MSLALSVPFLMDVLSRVAGTPIDSNAPPLQNQQTLLEPMEVGQITLLTLSATGLSPTTLSITIFERDGVDLTAEVSDLSWVLEDVDLRLGDRIDYQITAIDGGANPPEVSATAIFSEVIGQANWVLGSAAPGSFEILASIANGPAPVVFDAGNGALQIGGTQP